MGQGMYPEETYRLSSSIRGQVMGLTLQEAYVQARQQLCALSAQWCSATDAQLKQHICCEDGSIFVNDPIRQTICGTQSVPAPFCGQPGGGGDNTTMIIGLGALAVLGVVAVVVASKGKKKVFVGTT